MKLNMLLISLVAFSACTVPAGRITMTADVSCPGAEIVIGWLDVNPDAVISFDSTVIGTGASGPNGSTPIHPTANGTVTLTDSHGTRSFPITMLGSLTPQPRLMVAVSCADGGLSGYGLLRNNTGFHPNIHIKHMTPLGRDNMNVSPGAMLAIANHPVPTDVWAGQTFMATAPLYPNELCGPPTAPFEVAAPVVMFVDVDLQCQ